MATTAEAITQSAPRTSGAVIPAGFPVSEGNS
jgi:hypothetical protein